MPQSDDARAKAIWRVLLKELRAANPQQQISLQDSFFVYARNILIDGTVVEVRLDQSVTHRGTFDARRDGRFYFTIGGYYRHATRPRCWEKVKTGFDWPRIVQLVEQERQRVAAVRLHKEAVAAVRATALGQLKALRARRPELKSRVIVRTDGTFEPVCAHLSIVQIEAVLAALHDVGAEPEEPAVDEEPEEPAVDETEDTEED